MVLDDRVRIQEPNTQINNDWEARIKYQKFSSLLIRFRMPNAVCTKFMILFKHCARPQGLAEKGIESPFIQLIKRVINE